MASLKSTKFLIILVVLLLQFSGITSHGGSDHDHDAPDGDLRSKGLILEKIWCLIILFASTFAGLVSPHFYRWNEGFLLLGTQFAGGVFLGTVLTHYSSDANKTFGDLTSEDLPFSFKLSCAGSYLMMMFEDVVRRKDLPARVELVEEGGGKEAAVDSPVLMRTSSVGDTIHLILPLCFLSILEGIAVGVGGTKADASRNLYWTISLHKTLMAIATGIVLLRRIPKKPFVTTVACSFSFAISSPIGVGIGIALDMTSEGRRGTWFYTISMGLPSMHLVINHLISKGFQPRGKCYFDTLFFKFLAVLVGVGVMQAGSYDLGLASLLYSI